MSLGGVGDGIEEAGDHRALAGGHAPDDVLNSIGFWASVDDGLAELRRVLAPDALLVVGLRRRDRAAELARRLELLGFDRPSIADRRAGRKAVTTIVARRGR